MVRHRNDARCDARNRNQNNDSDMTAKYRIPDSGGMPNPNTRPPLPFLAFLASLEILTTACDPTVAGRIEHSRGLFWVKLHQLVGGILELPVHYVHHDIYLS